MMKKADGARGCRAWGERGGTRAYQLRGKRGGAGHAGNGDGGLVREEDALESGKEVEDKDHSGLAVSSNGHMDDVRVGSYHRW
jgi:hypothetical protein